MKTFQKTRTEITAFSMLYVIVIILLLSAASCFASTASKNINEQANHEKASFTFKVYCSIVQGILLEVELEELILSEKVEVMIYDMKGKLLYEKTLEAFKDQPIQEIDLETKVNTELVVFRAKSADKSIVKKVQLNY